MNPIHLPICLATPKPCPGPGIYDNVPAADYHAWNAVSSGTLKRMAHTSPAHVWSYFNAKKKPPTADMRFGTAVHAAILEPDLWASAVTIKGLSPKATAATFEKHAKDHGPIILAEGWRDMIERIVENVLSLDDLPQLSSGVAERCVVWDVYTDSGLTVRCKSRMDWCNDNTMLDIKTTRNLAPSAFSRDAHNLGYHISLAHYAASMASVGNEPENVHILAIETQPPFDCGVLRCSEKWLEYGREQWAKALDKLAYCIEMNEWPGYVNAGDELELPAWVR